MGDIFILLALLFFSSIPLIPTIINIVNLFKKIPIKEKLIDTLTIGLGSFFFVVWFLMLGLKDYDEPLSPDSVSFYMHTFVASKHLPTVILIAVIGLLGFIILRQSIDKLSPIITVVCISCVYIGCALSIIIIFQLSRNLFSDFFYTFVSMLFPFNFLLSSVRLIKNTIKYRIANINDNKIRYANAFLNWCTDILSHSLSWIIVPFILMLPLLGILIIILILFGQKPDAMVRAFTETSDWALSQKISPPPVSNYYNHYLCTVALKGDEKIVKPLRTGIRHGMKIVTNRQLCVANAFEQCLEERIPRVHRIIRKFYDKHGYPLSKHITTKSRANITYILMKPLEWLFVLFLYTMCKDPESKISIQYTGI